MGAQRDRGHGHGRRTMENSLGSAGAETIHCLPIRCSGVRVSVKLGVPDIHSRSRQQCE